MIRPRFRGPQENAENAKNEDDEQARTDGDSIFFFLCVLGVLLRLKIRGFPDAAVHGSPNFTASNSVHTLPTEISA